MLCTKINESKQLHSIKHQLNKPERNSLIEFPTFPLTNLLFFQDSVYVLAAAVKEMIANETITEAPKDCDDSGVIWESGNILFLVHFQK